MVLKDHLALVVITLQEHLRDSQKRMKKSELDDDKALYEYQRIRDIFISKEKQIQSNRFIFQEIEGSIQEEAVSTVKKGSKKII